MFDRFYDKLLLMANNFGPKIPVVLVTLAIGYIAIKMFLSLLRRILCLVKTRVAFQSLILSFSKIIMWILLLSELARQLGLSNLALTISGSVVALSFGLASGISNLANDIIAGVYLARDSDFEKGFRIKTGDIEGIVDRVDIRKVRIKSDDGKIHILPSSKLDTTGWTIIDREKE